MTTKYLTFIHLQDGYSYKFTPAKVLNPKMTAMAGVELYENGVKVGGQAFSYLSTVPSMRQKQVEDALQNLMNDNYNRKQGVTC